MPEHSMTKEDSSRIQSTQAEGGKDMSSKGFASRAQGAGDINSENNNSSDPKGQSVDPTNAKRS